MIFGKEKNINF